MTDFKRNFQKKDRVLEFRIFTEAAMIPHLIRYCEQQYGNPSGEEQIDGFTAEDCKKAIERYTNRFGKNARGPVEQLRDAIKISHYAQVMYDKLKEELNMDDIYEPIC